MHTFSIIMMVLELALVATILFIVIRNRKTIF